jgi:hypothetical protein
MSDLKFGLLMVLIGALIGAVLGLSVFMIFTYLVPR